MDKKQLSERDVCTKYITPALEQTGWDIATQVREEFPLTRGRVIVRGKLDTRAKHKRADYVLFYKPNIPVAVIEAKDNNHSVGDGMQQGLVYADMLQVPFVFSSDGDGFLFHNNIATDGAIERELAPNGFPSPNSTASSKRLISSWPYAIHSSSRSNPPPSKNRTTQFRHDPDIGICHAHEIGLHRPI
jgi:type I restriction enzyme R subunit